MDDGPLYDSTKAAPPVDNDEHHECGDRKDHDDDKGKDKEDHDKKFHGGKDRRDGKDR